MSNIICFLIVSTHNQSTSHASLVEHKRGICFSTFKFDGFYSTDGRSQISTKNDEYHISLNRTSE